MNGLIEIIVYSTKSGKFPFYEWLEDLDKRVMAKVSKKLLRLFRWEISVIVKA